MNRKKFLAIGLATLIVLAAGHVPSSAQTGMPLKVSPELFDFGTVNEGQPATVTAKVKNIGNTPIEIANVRTNWACTEAMLGKHRLSPNEETDLKVTFETEGRPGPFQKKVTFVTNIPGLETIDVFNLNGTVKEAPAAKIAVEPRKIVLESNASGLRKEQLLSITNMGSLPLVVSLIHSKDGNAVYFDGKKQGNLVIEPNQKKAVPIELSVEGKEGKQEYIIIESNAKNAGKTGYLLLVRYGGPEL